MVLAVLVLWFPDAAAAVIGTAGDGSGGANVTPLGRVVGYSAGERVQLSAASVTERDEHFVEELLGVFPGALVEAGLLRHGVGERERGQPSVLAVLQEVGVQVAPVEARLGVVVVDGLPQRQLVAEVLRHPTPGARPLAHALWTDRSGGRSNTVKGTNPA